VPPRSRCIKGKGSIASQQPGMYVVIFQCKFYGSQATSLRTAATERLLRSLGLAAFSPEAAEVIGRKSWSCGSRSERLPLSIDHTGAPYIPAASIRTDAESRDDGVRNFQRNSDSGGC
jgi:hypothetical protein